MVRTSRTMVHHRKTSVWRHTGVKKAPDFSGVFFMFALILILVMITHAMIGYVNIWFFLRISEESINDKIRCDHHERCDT